MLNSELNAVNRNQQLRRVNNQMARSASQNAKQLKAKGAARKKALEASTKAKDEALDELVETIDSSLKDEHLDVNEANNVTVQKIREERAATSGFGGGAYQSKNKKASDLRKVKGFGRGR